MKKKSVSAGLCGALFLSLLAGCAESPKKDVVTSKNDGVFQQNITVQATAPLDERLTYQDTFTSTDGTVTYTLDLDQELSSQPLPVVEVVPHYLTGEDVERVARAIFGDAEFYEKMPQTDPKFSKQQLQAYISWMSGLATQDALARLYQREGNGQTDFSEEVDLIKWYIQYFTTQLETAPEENPQKPCDWTFRGDKAYQRDAHGNDVISTTVKLGDIEYNIYALCRDKKDYKLSEVSVGLSSGLGLFAETDYLRAKLCRTPEPTEEQVTAAREKAQALLDRMELGTWGIRDVHVEKQDFVDAPEYTIEVLTTPVFGGVPALDGQLIYLTGSDANASSYKISCASFRFSANGDLISFDLESPVDVKSVVNEGAATLPLEELMDRVKNYFSLTGLEETKQYGVMNSWYPEPMTCQVTISELEYGLARMNVPNQEGVFYYSPAIVVYGHPDFYSQATGEHLENFFETGQNERYDLVWINAVDGSIL